MTQLDEQLEEIGLESLSPRWLADFLEIPRGRVYRAVEHIGAESIGRKGRTATYGVDTIIELAKFLYGQARFSNHTGRLPKDGLGRLKHRLGREEEPEPADNPKSRPKRQRLDSQPEPDGLWRDESRVFQTFAEVAVQSDLPLDAAAFTVIAVLQGAAWQAGDYPELKKHLDLGIEQLADQLRFDPAAWELVAELLFKVEPVAASPRHDDPDAGQTTDEDSGDGGEP